MPIISWETLQEAGIVAELLLPPVSRCPWPKLVDEVADAAVAADAEMILGVGNGAMMDFAKATATKWIQIFCKEHERYVVMWLLSKVNYVTIECWAVGRYCNSMELGYCNSSGSFQHVSGAWHQTIGDIFVEYHDASVAKIEI